ncbi:hypothetical protein C8J56DRAFT_773295, partial [Mycena floridula]
IKASECAIQAVTVFSKSAKAQITRHFTLDLKAGTNKIHVLQLPSTIDTESVRISGLTSVARLSDAFAQQSLLLLATLNQLAWPAIKSLLSQKSLYASQKRVHEHEAELLVLYGKSLSSKAEQSLKDFEGFLKSFVDQGKRNLDAVEAINLKMNQLQVQIDQQSEKDNAGESSSAQQGSLNGQILRVFLCFNHEQKSDSLIYAVVANASWEPFYSLHATTSGTGSSSSAIDLDYHAKITQCTGEDWNDTELTLSTVSVDDGFAKGIPALTTVKIKPIKPRTNGGFFQNQPTKGPIFGQKPGSGAFGAFSNPPSSKTSKSFSGFAATPPAPVSNNLFAAPIGVTTSSFGSFANNTQTNLFGGAAGVPATPQAFGLMNNTQPQGPSVSLPTNSFFGQAFTSSNQPTNAFGQASTLTNQSLNAALGSLFGQASASTPANQPTFGQASGNAFGQPKVIFGQTTAFGQLGNPVISSPPSDEDSESFEEIALPLNADGDAEGPASVVAETPLAITYTADGGSSIPSDGVGHQVVLAALNIDGKVEYVVAPRVDPRVFLQCQIENTSEYRLLPGPVTVFLNDAFVSKTNINETNAGDTFSCYLGIDTSTKVTYTRTCRTVKSTGGAFSESYTSTTYSNTITIQNKRQFPLTNLCVKDIVPMSGDQKIKVILRKPDGLADAKDEVVDLKDELKVMWSKTTDSLAGEKEGMFEWLAGSLAAGSKLVLLSEWEVKAPAEMLLSEIVGV